MRKYFLIIALIISTICLNAQENRNVIFYWGAYGGLNLNMHTADFEKLPGYPNCCPKFTGGSGTGFDFGALFEYPLQSKLNLTARVGLNSLGADLSETQIIGNSEFVSSTPPFETVGVADAESEYLIESSLQTIYIEPGLDYEFVKGFLLSGGFRLGFPMTGTFNQSETLLTPNDVIFKNEQSRIRNSSEGDEIPGLPGALFHIYLGLGYKVPIGPNSFLVPEIRYYQALNNISSESWSASNLKLGVAVKFPVYESQEIKRIQEYKFKRDTLRNYIVGLKEPNIRLIADSRESIFNMLDPATEVEVITVSETYMLDLPKDALLNVALNTYGLSFEGAVVENPTIIIEEIESEELFPVLPYVFFPENSSDLNASRLNLLSKSEQSQFGMDDLPWATLEIYSQMLNIVGKRLQENPSAKITLTGTNSNSNSERNNTELSRQRANSVAKYLETVWDINPNRITIQARNLPEFPGNVDRPEGVEENRRVEISSNNSAILSPVSMKDIIRKANPPTLIADPIVQADAEVAEWAINIMQDNVLLREFKGKGEPQRSRWDIELEPIPTLEKPVQITLDVKDKLGQSGSVTDSRDIKQLTIRKKRFEMKDDKRVEKYSLILFDYDKAEIKGVNKAIVDEIKKKIEPNSKVTIIGYADRTGETQYNRELAAKRTAEVQKILKVRPENLAIRNVGSDIILFDNNSPFGRNYCRTVQIIVETPVN
ncbi:MAG: OmpA family protein [Desulfobulbaceae bacterium]|nr:OmpA family protein [Desulfobulbaceae bacterium]